MDARAGVEVANFSVARGRPTANSTGLEADRPSVAVMRLDRSAFAGMLLLTMAMSTLAYFVLTVAATDLQDEFGISKFEIGLLGAANTGVGGLFAPTAGRLSDQLGGRRAMGSVLVISAVTSVWMALSDGYWSLMIGMVVAGLAQGWGNPATNMAIATGVPSELRGLTTGIKQSGVQVAVFTSGVAVPTVASAWGWRAAMWGVAGVSVLCLAGLRFITELDDAPPRPARGSRSAAAAGRLSPFVYQVGLFGFLLGFVGGGLGRFTPLFAEEAVGLSPTTAGLVFAVSGLVAIPTRIAAGRLLDRGASARRMLVVMGGAGAASILVTLGATWGPIALLWFGTVLNGMTLGSWNTAANLSMIRQTGNTGRASGVLLFGFLLGLTAGGPAVGAMIDATDGYTTAWTVSAGIAVIGAVTVALRFQRADAEPDGSDSASR